MQRPDFRPHENRRRLEGAKVLRPDARDLGGEHVAAGVRDYITLAPAGGKGYWRR
jgi:hypothetical protein